VELGLGFPGHDLDWDLGWYRVRSQSGSVNLDKDGDLIEVHAQNGSKAVDRGRRIVQNRDGLDLDGHSNLLLARCWNQSV
jgi:hypothetical protein